MVLWGGHHHNVWLKTREKNHIVANGVYINTKQIDDEWQVEVDTELKIGEDVLVSHTLWFKNQVMVTTSERVAAGDDLSAQSRQKLLVENPLLWSTDEPNLYQLVTKLVLAATDRKIESISHNIGFRSVVLDANQGFQLNSSLNLRSLKGMKSAYLR
ncbi:MAG: hypothetical protein ACQEXB_00065 [Bacillota bacterium]